jgi:hypothetical protein
VGAWGTGIFENDKAADWAAELEEMKTIQPVVSALQLACAEGYLEAPQSCRALVAAEVVAALSGNPTARLPKKVASWLRSHQLQVNEDLVHLALQAIRRIETQSELRELWEESDELAGWVATIKDLERRLIVV